MGASFGVHVEAQPPSAEERIEPSSKQLEALKALTPEAVAAGVAIKDDDLEAVATISTEPAYKSNGKFTDRVRSDNFLRALINKRTGDVTYQLYEIVTYGFIVRDFTSVNYATQNGPATAPVTLIDHVTRPCYYGYCSFTDDVAFEVDRHVLDQIGAQYVPGGLALWNFRFKARIGFDWDDRIACAEVAGFLKAVDAYRARMPVKSR